MSSLWYYYVLPGINPQPWEASEGSVQHSKRNGKKYIQMHKTPQLRAYQEAIKEEFPKRYPDLTPYHDPCELQFFFWRDLAAGQKASGRNVRAHVADATNLQKSTEDALQGILYKNDSQIIHVESWIIQQQPDTWPRILIALRTDPVMPDWPQIMADSLAPMPGTGPDQNLRTLDEELF